MNVEKREFRSLSISLLLSFAIAMTIVTGCVTQKAPESTLAEIRKTKVLRVGTTGDFMPFSYRLDGSSALHGVDIVFSRNLASALDVEVRFVSTTWPNLIDDLLASKFDVALSGITITPERRRVAEFSDPLMSSGKVAIAREESIDRLRTVEQINQPGVSVIVNPGGTNEAFARKNFPLSSITINEENLTVFEKIISGYADVMVTDAVEAAIQAKIHPSLAISNSDKPFNHFEFGILLPQDPTLKAYVDKWIDSQTEEYAYRTLFDAELAAIESRFVSQQN